MRKLIHVPCGNPLVYRREVVEDLDVEVDERLDVVHGGVQDTDEQESGLYCLECHGWFGEEVKELLKTGEVRLDPPD